MKKSRSLVSVLLGTTLLAGCSGTAGTIDVGLQNPQHKSHETSSKSNHHGTKTTKNKKGKAGEQKHKKKKAEKPSKPVKTDPLKQTFQSVKPSKQAKPLKSHYSSKVLKNMPVVEAHGGSTKRTEPFGQMILNGKSDKTNGPLKNHRLVAFYGTPLSKRMGVLGQSSPKVMMKHLIQQTKAYSELDPSHPAVPTIELIITSAQRNPGPDGLYVQKLQKDKIEQYEKLAKAHHALLLLDVQLGRDTVMHEVKIAAPYLKLPNVELAIDTEYHVGKGQTPGVNLGHVDGANIQKAVEYVNEIVKKNHTPDKVVVVHQFADQIIKNKHLIHPTDHVEVALNFDGFGSAPVKMAAYGKMVRKESIQYGGFKLFFKADKPLLSPKQVLQLDPAPAVVNYE